jgi:TolB-like protein
MKRLIMAVVLLCAGLTVYAQTKPRLGILPFTGGSGRDGDTIASLFSVSRELMDVFRIVPRTSSVEAVMREQEFQRSGITDSDTIADLGRQMNADYVVSGHIARLRNTNLLLISIVDVNTMRQITGDYREYQTIEGIPALLPMMAQNIISSIQDESTASAATLAVLPLLINDPEVQQDEAELLAQILATEIANSHNYAVFPRTRTIETALAEQDIQRSGMTDRESMAAIGKATNARYVLAGSISNLGSRNLFNIAILEIESTEQIAASYRFYQNLEDGIEIMGELSYELTGVLAGRYREQVQSAEAEQQQREAEQQRAAAKQERQAAKQQRADRKASWGRGFHNYLWGNGKSFAGISGNIGISASSGPLFFVNASIAIPIIPYLFVEGGIDYGFTGPFEKEVRIKDGTSYLGYQSWNITGYSSLYPYGRINVFLPIFDAEWSFYAGVGFGVMTETYELERKEASSWSYMKKTIITTEKKYRLPGFDIALGMFAGSEHHLFRIGLEFGFLTPEDKDQYPYPQNSDATKTVFTFRSILGYIYRFK